MRCIMIALLIGMCITCQVQAAEKKTPTFCYLDSLEAGLAGFSSTDSLVMECAQAVRDRIPLYREWQAEALRLGPRIPGRLDIITQSHFESRMTTDQFLILMYSQWRIRQLLDSLYCDVVGTEGFDTERIKLSDLERLVVRQINSLNRSDSVAMLRAQLIAIRWISTNNGMYHLKMRPQAHFLGWEDEALHRLNAALSIRFSRLPWWHAPDKSEDHLFFLAAHARSEMAIIKMVRVMAKYKRGHGAIVIGAGHEPEMAVLLKKYSVRGAIFDTVNPPDPLPQDWWK